MNKDKFVKDALKVLETTSSDFIWTIGHYLGEWRLMVRFLNNPMGYLYYSEDMSSIIFVEDGSAEIIEGSLDEIVRSVEADFLRRIQPTLPI